MTDVTTLEYHTCTTGAECGQLKRVTNALGHISTYDTYDAAHYLRSITDNLGNKIEYTYDLKGNRTKVHNWGSGLSSCLHTLPLVNWLHG